MKRTRTCSPFRSAMMRKVSPSATKRRNSSLPGTSHCPRASHCPQRIGGFSNFSIGMEVFA